jgi:hypothetical protein
MWICSPNTDHFLICEIFEDFGSDRREIFIAYAQSGSANSPHSQPGKIQFTPKNSRFTVKIRVSVQAKEVLGYGSTERIE